MSEQNNDVTPQSNLPETMYCVNHPQRETYLRCNRCNDPICIQCAVLTPTGYRCKNCIRGQQKVYETTEGMDVPIAAVVSALLAFGGSYIAPVMSFFIVIIGPLVGVAIEEVVRWLTKRRRSRGLSWAVVIGAGVGGAAQLLYSLTMLLEGVPVGSAYYLRLLWLAIYVVFLVSFLYYRFIGKR